MEEKVILRRSFLAMREALSEETREQLSWQIERWLEKLLGEKVSPEVSLMAYWPIRGEVDVLPLMKWWLKKGGRLFLPRVRSREIEVAEVRDLGRDVVKGKYGIPEPVGEMIICVPTFILVPGVVFDERGFRIGYGGGFYDRFLSRMTESHTIGVAYRFQVLRALPHDEHDVSLDRVVCEEGWLK
ncbi:5-formyltetrahydrofolate cyclo-ligase [Brevinematales bacterium NS]|nr:5-formyltetrahydrofolate cyclo-ligase [Brevinematales bacterium]QJR22555.1 5-formyltetrahydrofolate cyclo-ligase [Brevinematales bacterium NS]